MSVVIAVLFRIASGLGIEHAVMPVRDPNPGFAILFVLMWCMFLFFVIASNIPTRSSRLNLSLPISPRRLWLARMIAILSTNLLWIAIATLIIAVRFQQGI